MARPRMKEEDKAQKISITIKPDLMPVIISYCEREERSLSYCIDKALRMWLKDKGEL